MKTHVTRQRGQGSKREEESARMVYCSGEEKTNIAVVEDTEEMRKWRGLSQSEMDLGWKNGRGSLGKIQGRRKQKRGLQR